MEKKRADKSLAFRCLGVSLGEDEHENNVQGDCPFCGEDSHFFVNTETGQWDCKKCGKAGNTYTFLKEFAETTHAETTDVNFKALAKLRRLPAEAFKRYRVGFTGFEWIIPAYSEKGTVRDIRRWNQKRMASTEGCNCQLFGMHDLARSEPRYGSPWIWVCEGEWDAIAMRWILDKNGLTNDVVVAVPGSNVFKEDWVNFFRDRRVRLCYDNDDAGDKGCVKAYEKLKGVAWKIEFLNWPESRPVGWDINDFVSASYEEKVEPKLAMDTLVLLFHDKPRHPIDEKPLNKPTPRPGRSSPEKQQPKNAEGEPAFSGEDAPEGIPTFRELLDTFRQWIRVDRDFKDAIAICLAICLGNEIPGDPIWLYLIAPPGSGKTLALMTLMTSERTVFKSTLTPASLVSGFNVNPDPSLLPHLNGYTAIFKDGTELLALHPDARREAYSVLRGAFDGYVNKSFGNGLTREYWLHFNMIIGITPAVNGDNQSTMGERFLKFEMKENELVVEDKIRAAIDNINREVKMEEALSDVCRRFLAQKLDLEKLPTIPEWAIDRLIAFSQIVSMLRATVDRENTSDRDVRYRPTHETGTRVAKQLSKLGQMLAVVFGLSEVDDKVLNLLERVAEDTAIGFHMDIVKVLIKNQNVGLTTADIAGIARIPTGTTLKRLQDLEQLGVVRKWTRAEVVRSTAMWILTDRIVKLWLRAYAMKQVAPKTNISVSAPKPPPAAAETEKTLETAK